MSSPTDPPNEPRWDPGVPGPRDGDDQWTAPGTGGYAEPRGQGGLGGLEPGAGYAPGYGDPYGGGPTVGGPHAYASYGSAAGGPHPGGPQPGGPQSGGWAPKPGIVPLRPLALGEILDGATSYIRAHPRVVLGTSLIVAVIAHLIGTPLSEFLGGSPAAPPPGADLAAASDAITATATAALPLNLTLFLATTVLSGLLMVVISRAVIGAPVDAGEAWRAARPRLPGLFGVTLLGGLLSGLVLFVAMVPGLLLLGVGAGGAGVAVLVLGFLAGALAAVAVAVGVALAAPAYVLEGCGVIEALKRSWSLVKPRFWPVLGIVLLAGLIAFVVQFIITVPFIALTALLGFVSGPGAGALGSVLPVVITAVGGIVAFALVVPFQAGVTGLLYVDQRMRREGFDIELQRAASSGPPR